MRTVLFDIDGTLADLSHRLHHVTGSNRAWDAFFATAGDDGCYQPIRDLLLALSPQYTILLVLGRPDTIREATEAWLAKHGIPYGQFLMRKGGDHRSDVIVKSEILDEILRQGHDWTWPDETGHMWEAGSPHLSCIHKYLKINAYIEKTSQGSTKLCSCRSLKINDSM